jgi:hypothetical protein
LPVIINEIEVVEQPTPQPPAETPAPAQAAPAIDADVIAQLLRDAQSRQRRRVAD